tara:strand:- start:27 stop:1181 length:1155 start_codon:yes stop_codon:yes gene_type:complete
MKFNKLKFSHYFIFSIILTNWFIGLFISSFFKKKDKSVLLVGHQLLGNLETIYQNINKDIEFFYITIDYKEYKKLRELYGKNIFFFLNFFHVLKALHNKIFISSHGIFLHKIVKVFGFTTFYCGHSIKGDVPVNKDKTIKSYKLYDEVWLHSPCEKNILINELFIDPNNLKVLGYPRNQLLIENKTKQHSLKTRNSLSEKKIILYAPTSNRGSEEYNNSIFSAFNIEFYQFLENEFSNTNTVFVIKTHINDEVPKKIKKEVKNMNNIYFSENIQIDQDYDLLILSDILLTDLSTIYVDYLLLEKPIFIIDNPDPDPKRKLSSILLNIDLPLVSSKHDFRKIISNIDDNNWLKSNDTNILKNKIYDKLDHSKIFSYIEKTIINLF